MTDLVQVRLKHGPCHDQLLKIPVGLAGALPASVLVSRPRPPDADDDRMDYFTYYRVGDAKAPQYVYWRVVLDHEERR